MSDDLVKRLLAPAYWMSGSAEGHEGDNDAPIEAAAELTRLRERNAELTAACNRAGVESLRIANARGDWKRRAITAEERNAELEKAIQIEHEWGLDLEKNCDKLQSDRDSLRAKLERAKEAGARVIYRAEECGALRNPETTDFGSSLANLRATLPELSADAPAQQTQISDEVREAMVEAEKALEPFAELRVARFMTDGCRYDYRLDVAWMRHARATLTKLRSVLK